MTKSELTVQTAVVKIGTELPIGRVTRILHDGVEVQFKSTKMVASFAAVEKMVEEGK